MCFNCGCFNPDDDMGSVDNITNGTLKHLSNHWSMTLEETKKALLKMLENDKVGDPHLIEMFEKAAKAWGQSVDEAKKNTVALLKSQHATS